MKKTMLMAAIAAIFFCGGNAARATTLTGTVNNPDGSAFNGTIYLTLSQSATVSSSGTCGGPAYVSNSYRVGVSVVAGAIVSSPNIYDSNCFTTAGIPYSVQLVSSTGQVVSQTWVVTSTPLQTGSEDVGTIIPIAQSGVIFSLPAASNVTSLLFGTTSLPMSATAPNGSENYLCVQSGAIGGCTGGSGSGSGTVTNVSGATSGGFAVSTTNPATTPVVSVAAAIGYYMPTTTDEANWNGKQAALGYTPAHSGANSDITSLSGLTTALSPAQGGTGGDGTGYAYGNGTSGFSYSATIPYSALTSTPTLPATISSVSHEWLNSYSASTGLFTQTQPAFSDLSGSASPGQLPQATGSTLGAVECGSGTSCTGGVLSVTAGGAGTVTNFTAGNLSPLFTSSVANPTTTPALTFSLNTQNANLVFAGPSTGSAAAPTFRALIAGDIPTLTPSQVGLSSVTNDAQTKAAIVPNTAPGVGQILAGNAGGTAYGPVSVSGDCAITSAGLMTCTKSNGTAFGTAAFDAASAFDAAGAAATAQTNAETYSANGSNISSGTVAAARLPAGILSCTEVWSGSGTSAALQSGDDAIANNACYNDSGSTRTITAVKCRSDNASNTTTVNPTFGSAGTGTSILSAVLTCGSSYAYSSSGTITNASWTTGAGIDAGMGGTLTGTSIAVIVEYHY